MQLLYRRKEDKAVLVFDPTTEEMELLKSILRLTYGEDHAKKVIRDLYQKMNRTFALKMQERDDVIN